MADIDSESGRSRHRGGGGGGSMSGRTLRLWQLKLKSSLGECWRVRGRKGSGRRGVPYVPVFVLVALVFLVTAFLWRITIDPSYCRGTASRDEVAGEKFTIVVNTFKRPERLEKSIKHYARCPSVDAIRIVWSESPDPPRHLSKLTKLPVIFDVHEKNSINNRFVPLNGLRTQGVFNVDDDILVSCDSLQFGFETWRTSRDTLVGYNPRIHSKNAGECKYGYKQWWHVWWGGKYSIVLTKAAFCHHKYFYQYTHELSREVWNHVHENRNCEDIAMQFMVSNATGLPPIWVQGSYSDSGVLDFKGGISTGSSHYDKRSECVTKFVDMFGGMPLVETGHVAAPMSGWRPMKTPPAIWEWFHAI